MYVVYDFQVFRLNFIFYAVALGKKVIFFDDILLPKHVDMCTRYYHQTAFTLFNSGSLILNQYMYVHVKFTGIIIYIY